MKRSRKKLTAVFTAALLLTGTVPNTAGGGKLLCPNLTASAEDAPTSGTCGENLTWRFDEETGILTIEGSGDMEDHERMGLSDTAPWFAYRSKIKAAVLPDGLTHIGGHAFDQCVYMTSVNIPDSVTSFGCSAFSSCLSLQSITIPDSVTSISLNAFFSCESLTSIVIPDSVTSIDRGAFDACEGLTSITIPDSVTSIGWNAFSGCRALTGITLPDSVTKIDDYLFDYCVSLKSITIPDSVTSIGRGVFLECVSLTSITIPYSVTSIGENVFDGCKDLAVRGWSGSYAETYAAENGIPFESLGVMPHWGDATGDNSVDVADAVLICRFAVSDAEAEITDQGKINADVTHDGTVDAKDSEKLVRYLARFLTADDLQA